MCRRLFTLLVLRHSNAILAHHLCGMDAFARKMAFHAAGSRSMTLAIGNTVIQTVVRHSMLALAGKMAFYAAGCSHMLLAVAIEVPPHTTSRTLVIQSIAIEMTRNPAGLRTIMLLTIPLGMLRIAARWLAAIICSQRAGCSAHQQAQHQHGRYQFLQHFFSSSFVSASSFTETMDLLF